MFHVTLNSRVFKFSANETLGIEDGVGGVDGHLVLGSISDESLSVSEGNITWCGPVSLIIGNDLNLNIKKLKSN